MPRLVLPTQEMSESAAAYAAGFLDGEGTVTITKAGLYQFIYITIVQSEPGIQALQFIQAHFGGSLSRKPDGNNFKRNYPMWVLGIRSQGQVSRFLVLTLPHLIVKRTKAEAAIALLRKNGRAGTFWLPEEDAILYAEYRYGKAAELAQRFGRSIQSVRSRMKYLHHVD